MYVAIKRIQKITEEENTKEQEAKGYLFSLITINCKNKTMYNRHSQMK